VLTAYVSLVAALGDLFILRRTRTAGIRSSAAIARHGPRGAGRTGVSDMERKTDRDQGRPRFCWGADEAAALKAVEQLKWSAPPHYYMFARKLSGWSKADEVQADISDI
jgi:hypothetical protein